MAAAAIKSNNTLNRCHRVAATSDVKIPYLLFNILFYEIISKKLTAGNHLLYKYLMYCILQNSCYNVIYKCVRIVYTEELFLKIIIAGGGKVGATLTRQLSSEGYDITIIDSKSNVLDNALNRYDVMAVQGNCAAASVLMKADVQRADLLIAATSEDEVNLLCCLTAHHLNPAIHTIARIRNPEYSRQIYDMSDVFALSLTVNPEKQSAKEIERLLRFPGFLRRDTFANGRVEIVELRVNEKSVLCGSRLNNLQQLTGCSVLVCAVLRNGQAIMPDGDFVIQNNDRLFVTAPTSNLSVLLKNLGIITRKVKKVMICGGSRISYYLAQRISQSSIKVTIIDKDPDKCLYLAQNLPKADIVCGDATDQSFLENEGLADCDALVSMTSIDEMNIIISLFGNMNNVPQVITKLDHMENSRVMSSLPLGSIINPRELCSNIIVRYVRALKNQAGAALAVHSIADGLAEAEEFRIDESAKYCNVPLKDLRLKKNVLIVCINHGGQLIIPNGNSCFEQGDTVIVVTGRRNMVMQFNDIFEV